ncbi:MAG: alpha/beta hydrolase-fold protein [Chthoniobacterales bacterium]
MAASAWADGRIETMFIESGDEAIPSRAVRVWLPPGYNEGSTRYPVIYFHDGQNVFRPGGPFGCWFSEDAAAEEMKAGRMREAIMVAIPNNEADMGKARITEYQPPTDVNPRDPERERGFAIAMRSFCSGK